MIYGHGDDVFRYGDQVKLNFSSNVYNGADLSGLKDYLMQHFDVVGHYPEPRPHQLECLLAESLGVPDNTIMVTNGANEAIYLIAQLYKGWSSVIPQPTFNEYEDACKTFSHLVSYDSADELEVLPDDRQSYADYTLHPTLEPKELANYYNVLLIHSLSKRYCIPGLRLGYIYSSPIIIDRLQHIRQPWTVNALAIEAGKYLVKHDPKMIPDLRAYLEEASRLHAELSAIEGLMVMDSGTNFELKKWLIEQHGILIRDASNFRGLDNHCFRVTARTKEEDDQLIAALKQYMAWIASGQH